MIQEQKQEEIKKANYHLRKVISFLESSTSSHFLVGYRGEMAREYSRKYPESQGKETVEFCDLTKLEQNVFFGFQRLDFLINERGL